MIIHLTLGYGYGVQRQFQILVYRGGEVYWWRRPERPERTTDLPKVTDKLHSIKMYRADLAERNSNSQR
jgi:hypothetical protein